MVIALTIAIYILGCALTYVNFRKLVRRKYNRNWLLIERVIVIAISLYSWLAIVAFIVFVGILLTTDTNPDKEVKW